MVFRKKENKVKTIKIILAVTFVVVGMSLGTAWAQQPHPQPTPTPTATAAPTAAPQVNPYSGASAPSQRIPPTIPGRDVNAKPGVPNYILDTIKRPAKPAPGVEKTKIPAPGSSLKGVVAPRRSLSAAERQALQADMQALRQWYQGEQGKLRQQWGRGLQVTMAQTEARRMELLSELQTLGRQWDAIRNVARSRPAQVANIRSRLARLSSQAQELEGIQNRETQTFRRQSDALNQTYLQKQDDLIRKHYQPDTLTGVPLEDFAMTHFE